MGYIPFHASSRLGACIPPRPSVHEGFRQIRVTPTLGARQRCGWPTIRQVKSSQARSSQVKSSHIKSGHQRGPSRGSRFGTSWLHQPICSSARTHSRLKAHSISSTHLNVVPLYPLVPASTELRRRDPIGRPSRGRACARKPLGVHVHVGSHTGISIRITAPTTHTRYGVRGAHSTPLSRTKMLLPAVPADALSPKSGPTPSQASAGTLPVCAAIVVTR